MKTMRWPHSERLHLKMIVSLALMVLLSASVVALYGTEAQPGIKRTDLQQHDLSVPGREVVQALVEFAPGAVSARHSHPGEEIVYVVKGSLEYEVEGKSPLTLRAGEVLFIPAGAPHAARNVGKGDGAELATYVVEKGKPLITPAN
jgi:quercetin dioxygenase-like cupin family protein